MDPILTLTGVTKSYKSAGHELTVLRDINFSVDPGGSMAIVGPSGSGKTTLLGLSAGLDKASAGSVHLSGVSINEMNEDERARLRNQYVGFIFQNFQLMPTLTALENVMVPLELRREKNIKPRAVELLGKVGLSERMDHYPVQLSGGEQQRVAMARAFSTSPKLLFADEPTGNLDEESGENVVNLLFGLNREAGTTLIIVTHNQELASKTQRILRLKAGRIVSDEKTHAASN
ncbi:MAG TPA: ABC transporter ATP-binding protein [Flavitalea sp.]|nr:ABC transporter ATP-binding protein [Flavitalea sp.]